MKLKSFLKRLFLIEEKIEIFRSPINGEISIYEDLFGNKTMRIDKVSQSGELVDRTWKRALREIHNSKFTIHDSLILGLGCGGCAKLVSKKWPNAKMVGVDIDPVVVEVGKKYFRLGEIPNLKIIIGDAFQEIKNQKSKIKNTTQKSKVDLILIDLYLGQSFPREAESEEFINGIKNLLNDKGVVVFNRLYWGKYQVQAKEFAEKLRKYFPKVWLKKANYNLLIFCQ